MNPQAQQRFLRRTRWLRPFTRAAASLSLHTEGWLPGPLRRAPLALVRWLLQAYQKLG